MATSKTILLSLGVLAALSSATFCGERLSLNESLAVSDLQSLPEILPFAQWRRVFGKVYASDDELQHRARAFAANVEFIRQHNADNRNSFRLGVNQFSDLTNAEFKARVFPRRLPPAQPPHNTKWLPTNEQLAATTIDWRTKGAVTPVKNQAKCGSCWAFSTTGSVEAAFFLATGELRSASEQQLADCSGKYGNHGCSGGLMDNGFKYILANKGIDSEDDYNYISGNGTDYTCWSNAEKRVVLTIDNYTDVPRANEAQLAAAVMLQPVSVALEADKPVFQHYKSGVMDDGASCGTTLDHGVLVVGLTADAYIVKNSWGPTWGDKGYIQLKRNYNKSVAVGICGIATQPSYPIKAKGQAPPVPAPTPSGTRPGPVPTCPGCTAHDISTCGAFGMHCCCHNASSAGVGAPRVTCHASADCCCKNDACGQQQLPFV